MNAPLHLIASAPADPGNAKQVVKTRAAWPERWQAFKGTAYWREALLTIAEEAAADTVDQDNELAGYAYDAATASDAEERQSYFDEIERIFDEMAAKEDFDARCYAYEARTGKGWDECDELWREAYA